MHSPLSQLPLLGLGRREGLGVSCVGRVWVRGLSPMLTLSNHHRPYNSISCLVTDQKAPPHLTLLPPPPICIALMQPLEVVS